MNKDRSIRGRKYVTSDLSGRLQMFETDASPLNTELKNGDFLFVCGDFGFIWNPDSYFEKCYLDIIQSKPFVTCFIDGNHENFNVLEEYPVEMWNGGRVHVIRRDSNNIPKIIHLMRGEYYDIEGDTFFTFGGGNSSDKSCRIENETWWKQEMPTREEMQHGLRTLEKHKWKCDYILTHALPEGLMETGFKRDDVGEKPLNIYLEKIRKKTDYKHWYSGHLHINRNLSMKNTILHMKIRNMKSNQIL